LLSQSAYAGIWTFRGNDDRILLMLISGAERLETPPNFDYDAFALPENIALTFRLHPHNSAKDLPSTHELGEEIRSYDGVVLEVVSNERDDVWLQKIANGNYKEYQALRSRLNRGHAEYSGWLSAMGSAVYDSKVALGTIDVHYNGLASARFFRANDTVTQKFARARSGDDILAFKDDYVAELETYRARDQKILGNIAPKLGAMSLGHRKMGAKRMQEPVNVGCYYGSVHRSLVDALLYKQKVEPQQGFSVGISADSDLDIVDENLYALHLRGMELPDEALIGSFAIKEVVLGFTRGGYFDLKSASYAEMQSIASHLVQGRSYAEARELANELAQGAYDIFVSPTGEEVALFDRDTTA
jgi:hypothetical protein